jgi:flagellar secretion chaperone FliS
MKGWKKYQDQMVLTSNAGQLTVMAYERCMLNLNIAKEKIEVCRYKEAGERIENTKAIIKELFLQINREAYPELAEDLYKLYGWLLNELEHVGLKKETEKIGPMLVVLNDLAEGFRGALNKNEEK